jgi:hypothetical protein
VTHVLAAGFLNVVQCYRFMSAHNIFPLLFFQVLGFSSIVSDFGLPASYEVVN